MASAWCVVRAVLVVDAPDVDLALWDAVAAEEGEGEGLMCDI